MKVFLLSIALTAIARPSFGAEKDASRLYRWCKNSQSSICRQMGILFGTIDDLLGRKTDQYVPAKYRLPKIQPVQGRNTLVMHFFRAPNPFGWTRPQEVARKTAYGLAKSKLGLWSHIIGHVNAHVACEGEKEAVLVGMTGAMETEDPYKIFTVGSGMSIMFDNFRGKLDGEKEQDHEFEWRLNHADPRKRINSLEVELSAANCQRLMSYIREYKARRYDKVYGGLASRARYGEGAGCSEFAMSLLDIVGLKNFEVQARNGTTTLAKEFSIAVNVPLEMMGPPYTDTKVNYLTKSFLSSDAYSWAEEDEPHYPARFFDPTQMWEFVDKVHRANSAALERGEDELPYPDFSVAVRMASPVLFLDATRAPTPEEPLFFTDMNADYRMDEKQVWEAATRQMTARVRRNMKNVSDEIRNKTEISPFFEKEIEGMISASD